MGMKPLPVSFQRVHRRSLDRAWILKLSRVVSSFCAGPGSTAVHSSLSPSPKAPDDAYCTRWCGHQQLHASLQNYQLCEPVVWGCAPSVRGQGVAGSSLCWNFAQQMLFLLAPFLFFTALQTVKNHSSERLTRKSCQIPHGFSVWDLNRGEQVLRGRVAKLCPAFFLSSSTFPGCLISG